ncbi:ribosomal-protein-alanine N-acetyltransferase [Motilimonas pumila]|uniref:[Ribosomal protein bS18]-alanine N-acetyltransferase n=2 Tax=Motilimonas pumila TaxID=2303987 RepID=A0A418YL12_9GAMM|nr:ribosomal-protein-alanine N-acetyltransferase [Motilimonas pumila]
MCLDDIAKVHQVERLCHSHPWSVKLFASNFGQRYFNSVITYQEQIVGYMVASEAGGEVTLLNIAVHPEHQGKGLGKRLLELLKQQASHKQCDEIWLEVRVSNRVAITAYLGGGFVEVDRRKGYYPSADGREDAVIMCCYLDKEV